VVCADLGSAASWWRRMPSPRNPIPKTQLANNIRRPNGPPVRSKRSPNRLKEVAGERLIPLPARRVPRVGRDSAGFQFAVVAAQVRDR
jgi:hypothetical protein